MKKVQAIAADHCATPIEVWLIGIVLVLWLAGALYALYLTIKQRQDDRKGNQGGPSEMDENATAAD